MPVEPPAELVERLRAELPELPAERIRRVGETLDHERALVLVTGGLDALWEATVAAGAEPVAASNVIANQLVGAGVEPGRRRRRPSSRSSSTRASGSRGRRSTRRSRMVGDAGLLGRAVPRAGGGLGRGRARADRRRDPRREPGAGRAVPGRQGRPARLLRRPGDEGDEGPGRRARGQRARAGEARGVDDAGRRRATVGDVPVARREPGSALDELRLAARNHAMPLEALRWPITPVGLHYLLIHYDVPLVDPDAVAARGRAAPSSSRSSLSLDELRARAGGRARRRRWSAPGTVGRCSSRGRSASRG